MNVIETSFSRGKTELCTHNFINPNCDIKVVILQFLPL